MKPIFSLLLASLLATAPATPGFAQAPAASSIDSIVAIVDEDVILRSELDRAVANITSQFAAHPEQLPPRDILEKQVLDRLVTMRLQIVRASDSGIRVSDTELQQAAATVARNNNMTAEQLRDRLATDGMSVDEFQIGRAHV